MAPVFAVFYRSLLGWRPFAFMYYLRALEMPLQLACFGAGLAAMASVVGNQSYASYIYPGLIVLYLWFAVIMEATYVTFTKAFYHRIWSAILATPITLPQILLGEQLLALMKALTLTLLFWPVGVYFNLVANFQDFLFILIPLSIMILCLCSFGYLLCSLAKNEYDFDPLWPLLSTPMMLTSGIFYPVSTFPEWVQHVVWISPLYHGVEIIRPVLQGIYDWPVIVGHSLVLMAMWLAFSSLAYYQFKRRFQE
ncbi:MAG: hypothetical protein EBQ80_06210 [Proteobacteria bacterium]|nr:hypothetical protein [Pseudomonadota bacterium]